MRDLSVREQVTKVRCTMIVDPHMKVALSMTYPASTGRNFHELLRCFDSLQLTARGAIATPANWKAGEDVVILPSVDDAAAHDMFPAGFVSIKPFLRITPAPATK